MKTVINFAVASAVSLFAALGATSTVHAAEITNHSGTICKNYNAAEATSIDYLTKGTRSYKSGVTYVICPLTRNTSNSAGARAYVDISHGSYGTTSCTLYSYSDAAALLGSASQSWTGTGFHEFSIYLGGSGKSNAWSDYSVLCSIPGSSNGLVTGVDLYEY